MKYIVDMHDEKMNIVTCISTDNCHSISDAARNTEKLLEFESSCCYGRQASPGIAAELIYAGS